MQETRVWSLGWEDMLEKETHPVFLPGKSHGQRNLAGTVWGVIQDLDTTLWLNTTREKERGSCIEKAAWKELWFSGWGMWPTEQINVLKFLLPSFLFPVSASQRLVSPRSQNCWYDSCKAFSETESKFVRDEDTFPTLLGFVNMELNHITSDTSICLNLHNMQLNVIVHLLSQVQLFALPWTVRLPGTSVLHYFPGFT